jgi:hypothetical protein
MNRPLVLALRFMAIMAALLVVTVIFAPSSPKSSPYISALGDLTAGSALAAPKPQPCNNMTCGPGGINCRDFGTNVHCTVKANGTCRSSTC